MVRTGAGVLTDLSPCVSQNLYDSDADFQVADRVVELTAARGVAPPQVALAWLLAQSGMSVPADRSRSTRLEPARRGC
ncbi:MAG TPA: hypothetical protein VGK32_08200 [Vicinamibacterales bacterium]